MILESQTRPEPYYVNGRLKIRKPFWVAEMADIVLMGLDEFYSSSPRETVIEHLDLAVRCCKNRLKEVDKSFSQTTSDEIRELYAEYTKDCLRYIREIELARGAQELSERKLRVEPKIVVAVARLDAIIKGMQVLPGIA